MKNVTFILLLLWTSSANGQMRNWSSNFAITGQVVNYEGKDYKNIYPIIKTNETSLNKEINKHKRRFEYILQNRTDFKQDSFQSLFPDTLKMTTIYQNNIKKDPKIKAYFLELANPLIRSENPKEIYTLSEMMTVASKFFYCDNVRPDTTISVHVCIGINGQESSKLKDYTLLEAICFEAIFEKMFDRQNTPKYLDDFSGVVEKNSKIHKNISLTGLNNFLIKVRTETYKEMESNESLKTTLLSFVDRNKDNLPFQISN